MIRLGTWRQNGDVPGAGMAGGGSGVAGGWVYSVGLASSGVTSTIRAPILDAGALGPWLEVQTPYGMIAVGVPAALPNGKLLYGLCSNVLAVPDADRASFMIVDDPDSGVVRIGPRSRGSFSSITASPIPLGDRFGGATNLASAPNPVNTPWFYEGDICGPRGTSLQVRFLPGAADPNNPTAATWSFRQHLFLHGQLWYLCGYNTTGVVPLIEIRAAPVAGGVIGPQWRTMGHLPVSQGFSRVTPVVWRDYIIVAGGNADPTLGNSATDSIWAVKTTRDGLVGPWILLGILPAKIRSHHTFVEGDYLHIVGGILDGVASSGDYENACYSVHLED